MFTQSMPALAQALSGALPEAAVKQLMQALGNCQQPLTHRGSINLQPPTTTGPGGLAQNGTWNPGKYTTLMPKAGDNVFVDMPGGNTTNNSVTNTTNYDGNNFYFPVNQDFNYSTYYGGDTFNVAGDSTFNNSTVNNFTSQNSTIENLSVTNVYYTNDPGGGEPDGGGGMGGGGGGNPRVPRFPGVVATSTFLKDVTVRGNVTVPTVETATVRDKTVNLTNVSATTTVALTGTVPIPNMASATSKVGIPTSGPFSASVTGLKLTPGIGTLTGTVTIPIVTGGYMDANCKLQLTTSPTPYTVSLSGAPAVTVDSMGAVTGSVTLNANTQTFAVTFACTGTLDTAVSVTGDVTYYKATTAALKDDAVTIVEGVVNKKLNLTVKKSSDFIIYIRPTF